MDRVYLIFLIEELLLKYRPSKINKNERKEPILSRKADVSGL